MKYLYIGNVKIQKTAALAPMAGVADYPYRSIAKNNGAAYLVSEMVSAKGVSYGDVKSRNLLKITEEERPYGIQLFGADPYYMAKAAKIALENSPDILDINSGCPVPKVTKDGGGSALLKNPKLLEEIIASVVKSVNIPVTVKIRLGWDSKSINAVDVAKLAESAGAAAITVHGRTKEQLYGGTADWETIASVKKAVKIPVIGNGDVKTLADCLQMYRICNCDLVMIGRASYGNPWLFKEISHYFNTGIEKTFTPSLKDRLDVMTEHINLLVNTKGEYIGMKEARKVAGWYIKGLNGAAKLRNLSSKMSKTDDFYFFLEEVKELNE